MADKLEIAAFRLEGIGETKLLARRGKLWAIVEHIELRCRNLDELRQIERAFRIPFLNDLSIDLVDIWEQAYGHVFIPRALVLDENDAFSLPEEREIVFQIIEEDAFERRNLDIIWKDFVFWMNGLVEFRKFSPIVEELAEDGVFDLSVRHSAASPLCSYFR